jgi:hypothetical protein
MASSTTLRRRALCNKQQGMRPTWPVYCIFGGAGRVAPAGSDIKQRSAQLQTTKLDNNNTAFQPTVENGSLTGLRRAFSLPVIHLLCLCYLTKSSGLACRSAGQLGRLDAVDRGAPSSQAWINCHHTMLGGLGGLRHAGGVATDGPWCAVTDERVVRVSLLHGSATATAPSQLELDVPDCGSLLLSSGADVGGSLCCVVVALSRRHTRAGHAFVVAAATAANKLVLLRRSTLHLPRGLPFEVQGGAAARLPSDAAVEASSGAAPAFYSWCIVVVGAVAVAAHDAGTGGDRSALGGGGAGNAACAYLLRHDRAESPTVAAGAGLVEHLDPTGAPVVLQLSEGAEAQLVPAVALKKDAASLPSRFAAAPTRGSGRGRRLPRASGSSKP